MVHTDGEVAGITKSTNLGGGIDGKESREKDFWPPIIGIHKVLKANHTQEAEVHPEPTTWAENRKGAASSTEVQASAEG